MPIDREDHAPSKRRATSVSDEDDASVNQVQIIDLTGTFLRYWDQAQNRTHQEQVDLWDRLYKSQHLEWLDVPLRRHRFAGDVDQAVDRFDELAQILERRRDTVVGGVQNAVENVLAYFAAPPMRIQVVLLVGLYAADGWVDDVGGQSTIFIALEALEHDGQAACLAAHEVAHVVHFALLDGDPMVTVGDALFEEGLAVAVSDAVVPGMSEAQLLWIGRQTTADRQPVDQWLTQCQSQLSWKGQMLEVFESEDDASYIELFLGRQSLDMPDRFGYYAGLHGVRSLERETSLTELARWSRSQARSAFRALLKT